MNCLKALIIDWDGVLVDTERIHEMKEILFAKRHGYVHTPKLKQALMGRTIPEAGRLLKKKFRLKEPLKMLIGERRKIYKDLYYKHITLMPGAHTFLKRMYKKYLLTIATASERRYVTYALRRFGLKSYFQSMVTSADVRRGKPAPDLFLCASKRIGIPPEECVVIEDSLLGVRAAKAAGMRCIAIVDTRYNAVHAFSGHADVVVTSLRKLIAHKQSALKNTL